MNCFGPLMPSFRRLYRFLSGRPAPLPGRSGWYRSGPGAPEDSPPRCFCSWRGAARRSAGSNRWSDYPITSLFTSVRQQNMSRNQQVSPGQGGEQHRGRATPDLQLLTIRTETSQNASPPSELYHSSKCPWKNPLRLKAFPPVARTLCVPAHHRSSVRSLREGEGEGEVRQGSWERG